MISGEFAFELRNVPMVASSASYSDLFSWKDPQLTGAVFAAGNLFFFLWGLGCVNGRLLLLFPEDPDPDRSTEPCSFYSLLSLAAYITLAQVLLSVVWKHAVPFISKPLAEPQASL